MLYWSEATKTLQKSWRSRSMKWKLSVGWTPNKHKLMLTHVAYILRLAFVQFFFFVTLFLCWCVKYYAGKCYNEQHSLADLNKTHALNTGAPRPPPLHIHSSSRCLCCGVTHWKPMFYTQHVQWRTREETREKWATSAYFLSVIYIYISSRYWERWGSTLNTANWLT